MTTTAPTIARRPRPVDYSLTGQPRRSTIAQLPDGLPAIAIEALADVREQIATVSAESREVQAALALARRDIAGAKSRDQANLAAAMRAGRADPGAKEEAAATKRLAELERRAGALGIRRTELEDELAATLEEGRARFAEAARGDVDAGLAAIRASFDELRAHWLRFAASRTALRFLERPYGAKLPGTPQLGRMVGLPGSDATDYQVSRVLDSMGATVAELEVEINGPASLKAPRLGHAVTPEDVFPVTDVEGLDDDVDEDEAD
jgi:hypothetical protein